MTIFKWDLTICKMENAFTSNAQQKKSEGNFSNYERWTREEALLYEKFIEMYADIMRDSSSKRNTKIFLLMSKFIGISCIFHIKYIIL